MPKLIITADIHGSYSAWLTILHLLEQDDSLVIAGDLFDTKYGNYSNTDFKPESIKNELIPIKNAYHYVYGNCDTQSFFKGFATQTHFQYDSKKIFLHHGHKSFECDSDTKVIIQGHTHLCSLIKKGGQIYLNPGSIACPRNNMYTYGLIENDWTHIIELRSGEKLASIKI